MGMTLRLGGMMERIGGEFLRRVGVCIYYQVAYKRGRILTSELRTERRRKGRSSRWT